MGQLGPLLVFFLLPHVLPKPTPEATKKEEVVDFSLELDLTQKTLNASSSTQCLTDDKTLQNQIRETAI